MKFSLSLLFLLFLSGIFFFRITTSYRMPPSYNYDSDFGRDLLLMQRINHGKQILIGPQLSFAGLHLGSYPFYLFAPFLRVGNTYKSVLVANALIFILGLFSLFFYLSKKLGIKYSLLSLLWLSTTPYIILAARSPGNAFSYLIFLMWYLAVVMFWGKFTFTKSIILGGLAGFIVNFHPVGFIAVVIPFLAKTVVDKRFSKKEKFYSSLIFFFSLILTFIPVIVFEIRHKFVISQTIFETNRYSEFFGKNNSMGIFSLNSLLSFNQASSEWLPISIIGLCLILIIVMRYSAQIKEVSFWLFVSLLSVFSLILFGKWAPHYFFPIIALCQMSAIIIIKKFRYNIVLMVLFILINIIYYPQVFYSNARNLEDTENRFVRMLKSANLPKQDLNVVLLNDTHLSIVGYEYRYLLEKNGYQILDEFSYKNSRFLLLISEKNEINWKDETSWELSQFGNKKLMEKHKIGNTVFYIFEKVEESS